MTESAQAAPTSRRVTDSEGAGADQGGLTKGAGEGDTKMSSRNLSQRLKRLEASLMAASTRPFVIEVQFVSPSEGVVRTLVLDQANEGNGDCRLTQARTQDEGDHQTAASA